MSANLIEGSHTVCNIRRDFAEWHLGRSPYVFWALDVDRPAIRAAVARAGRYLAGRMLDGYCRQPHVTLDLCGFPCANPGRVDEFSRALLDRQCAALGTAQVPVFEIDIGGLGSFSSAPFLKVVDRGDYLATLRSCLAVDGQPRLYGDYVPHVTVGLYGGAWPAGEIGSFLAAFPEDKNTGCRIERISLMSYQPADVGGPLNCVADYELATGEMRWHRALPWSCD